MQVGNIDAVVVVVVVTVAVTVTVDALVIVTVKLPSSVTVEIPHCVFVDVGDDVNEPVTVGDVDADVDIDVEGIRHEQAELSLEVDALQGEAKAGKLVAV